MPGRAPKPVAKRGRRNRASTARELSSKPPSWTPRTPCTGPGDGTACSGSNYVDPAYRERCRDCTGRRVAGIPLAPQPQTVEVSEFSRDFVPDRGAYAR
jgi:hypothetical protein